MFSSNVYLFDDYRKEKCVRDTHRLPTKLFGNFCAHVQNIFHSLCQNIEKPAKNTMHVICTRTQAIPSSHVSQFQISEAFHLACNTTAERERTFLLRKNPSLYNCFVAFSANDNDHAIDYYSKIVSTTGSFHARTIRPTDTTAVTAPPKKQTITRNCRHRVRFDSKQKRKIGFMKLSAIEKIQFPRY